MNFEPKKLLWPTDFSEHSLEAIGFAKSYAKRFGAELHAIHVCAPLPHPEQFPQGLNVSQFDKNVLNAFLEAARNRLQQITQEHFSDVSPVHCEVLSGHPMSEICDYAKDKDIDLIIIATHGLTGLRHVLMGSVAERVVRHAPCPVLTFKPGT
jgi:universal stress protein A